MKLRTSYFDPTAFRKNLTRFAPAWVLYGVMLLLALFLMLENGLDYWFFQNIGEMIQVMPAVNIAYALLCAQLLFGDLYNARMCNMLHALPIRREGWFVTHVASGLFFALVPNLLAALVGMALSPFSNIPNAWQIPLYWWLGSGLQFVFFFGLATLAAFCVGSRFAQAVVYGIANLASILAYWLADTLYTPMLYGIATQEDPFYWFCPLVKTVNQGYLDFTRNRVITPEGFSEFTDYSFSLTGHWWYLAVCAGVGIAFLALALVLYRKRRLEVAGDFIAVKALEPVFLVVYTLVMGTCFHYLVDNLFGYAQGLIFLFVGLLIGWFTGRMLLERRVNVFHRRSFLGCGALLICFVASLLLVNADPFGAETWVPEADEVVGVGIHTGHGTYHQSSITLTEREDIEKIIALHEYCLESRIDEDTFEIVECTAPTSAITSEDGPTVTYVTEESYKSKMAITLTYDLGGITRSRYYWVWVEDPEGQMLGEYFSTTEAVLGMPLDGITDDYIDALARELYISGWFLDEVGLLSENLTHEDKVALVQAIIADCQEGTMAQYYEYWQDEHTLMWLWFENTSNEINLNTANTHFLRWLTDMGIDWDTALRERYDDYGT